MVMVLAVMALSIPLITATLGLASTLSIDSRIKTNIDSLVKTRFEEVPAL